MIIISHYSISGYMRTSGEVWTDLKVELPIQSLYLEKVGTIDDGCPLVKLFLI